jgi:hypothetical protein
MPRTRRVMPFLQRRQATWYLRFRLPVRLQGLAGRSELRLSLGTRELSVARQRAEQVLPDVYCLKQLARHMSALEPMHVRGALDLALSRIVDELRRTREPWMRGRAQSIHALENGLGKLLPGDGVSKLITPGSLQELQLTTLRGAIERGDHRRGAERARELLQEIGAPVEEESPHFRQLAIEVLKLDAMYLEAQKARASGDFRTEEELIAYYMRSTPRREPRAVLVTGAPAVVAPSGARLSEAWQEYAREKMAAMPRPQWGAKTAAFQDSTFREFLEIVSDLTLGEVNREIIIRYAETLRKLPKNRRKIHGDRPIQDLLVVNVSEKAAAGDSGRSHRDVA